jgi:4-hydroxybenzoate polyprenyltransferase
MDKPKLSHQADGVMGHVPFVADLDGKLVQPYLSMDAVVVMPVPRLIEGGRTTEIERVYVDPPPRLEIYFKALRPHHWLKNTLLFAPLAIDYQFFEPSLLVQAALAFVAFSLCASSGYLFNDLMDLPSDRHHPRKKNRPLPSGKLLPAHAIVLMLMLLLGGIAVSVLLPWPFLGALGGYYALTLAYSLGLKNVVILDVVTLAVLHALRVVGGALAVSIPPSLWLLAFCIFLFLSLALIKRYAELRSVDGTGARARAYLIEDRELLASLGGASGYLAALVLGLYIGIRSAPQFVSLYQLFWLDCLLLLYWVSYMWLMAHRGRMDDDPLAFAIRDGVCRKVLLLMAAIYLAATLL